MPEPDRFLEFLSKMEQFYNTMWPSKELFSQLAIIPKAGHVVFFENFDAVWASIRPFFEQ